MVRFRAKSNGDLYIKINNQLIVYLLKTLSVFLLVTVFFSSVYLFYLYSTGEWFSDFPAHIYFSISGTSSYSLLHVIFNALYSVCEHPLLIAFAGSIITLTVMAVFRYSSMGKSVYEKPQILFYSAIFYV